MCPLLSYKAGDIYIFCSQSNDIDMFFLNPEYGGKINGRFFLILDNSGKCRAFFFAGKGKYAFIKTTDSVI